MRNRFKKTIAQLLSIAMVVGFYASSASATDMLKNANVLLSNSKAATPSNYTFTATVKTAGTVYGVKMTFRTTASGANQFPSSIGFGGASLNATKTGLTGAWALDNTTGAGSGELYLTKAAGDALNGNDTISWTVDGITNPNIVNAGLTTGCPKINDFPTNGLNSSAGRCFIDVKTYGLGVDTVTPVTAAEMSGEAVAPIDASIVAFTINPEMTVSARVDPTLAFTVVGTNVGTTAARVINGSDTTTAAQTDASTLPFGNLTVGTAKVLAQKLYVKTNAVGGYSVKMRSTSTNPLNGIYTAAGNKIDPFDNNNTANGANTAPTWTVPQPWAAPINATANNHSAYIGVSTSDTDVWAGTAKTGDASNKWAPLNSTSNEIMKKASPDLGAEADSVQITYAIEANVYQPADTYSGTLQYNCVPTY